MKKKLIIFIDSGDTLIDEATQIYDDKGIVTDAKFIDGAIELLDYLRIQHHRTCLVADGEIDSFENVFTKDDRKSMFEGWIVSEVVGVQKPNREMFDAAMDALNLTDSDKDRIIMIGNNLKKDIAGANEFGIKSLWISWSPRYFQRVEKATWQPDFTAKNPLEVIEIIKAIESSL